MGPDSPLTAQAAITVAEYEWSEGHYSRAQDLFERGTRVLEKALGPKHHASIEVLLWYGEMLLEAGKSDEAAARFRTARELALAAFGDKHFLVAMALGGLGDVEVAKGNAGEAIRLLESAKQTAKQGLGEDHPLVGIVGSDLGEAYLRAHDPRGPGELQAAIVQLEAGKLDPVLLARAKNRLARALADGHIDDGRAAKVASEAREALAGYAGRGSLERADSDALLLRIQGR